MQRTSEQAPTFPITDWCDDGPPHACGVVLGHTVPELMGVCANKAVRHAGGF